VGKFILGVIVTAAALVIGGLSFAMLGLFPTEATTTPPRFEQRLAHGALDASMKRHAPQVPNPLPPSDQNLIDGMKIYYINCSLCHGGLDRKPAPLAENFYPPAPNLISDPPDNPEWYIFFTIRNGVRYTGMPAWDGALAEQDMWKVTAFLSQMHRLPPAVREYWQETFNVDLQAGETGERHEQNEGAKH
jgi:mono/diheme cytochrome c family protein